MPLVPATEVEDGEYEYPWIPDVEDYLMEWDETTDGAEYVGDEEVGAVYVFMIAGSSENELLSVALTIATRSGVPAGTFAMVTSDGTESFGMGRRVELSRP